MTRHVYLLTGESWNHRPSRRNNICVLSWVVFRGLAAAVVVDGPRGAVLAQRGEEAEGGRVDDVPRGRQPIHHWPHRGSPDSPSPRHVHPPSTIKIYTLWKGGYHVWPSNAPPQTRKQQPVLPEFLQRRFPV